MSNIIDRIKKNGWAIKLVLGFFILGIIYIFLTSEWFSYYIIYKPFYNLFRNYFYSTYFLNLLGTSFIFLLLICISFFCAFCINYKERFTKLNLVLGIFSILFMIFGYLAAKPFVLDLRLVVKKQYLVTESDLSRCRKEIHSSGKGSSVHYKLYTYELENNEKKLNFQKNKSDLYRYKSIDLNFYQYRDLEKLKVEESLNDDSINTGLEVYYLSNTDIVLQYELIK